ncbi:helix-turn-helix domain-containing protein [Dysgonomonas sp. ZJ709]|uniref:helix-turn-helix domain-containing protein n=1 Tax=Dysgonomonas sp. ZJ709 TaxID=2709797 RepID=UPI0013EBA680|nr:helix-turn-helix domain-containing protein [Dysgonomonas sp. ZJ709]
MKEVRLNKIFSEKDLKVILQFEKMNPVEKERRINSFVTHLNELFLNYRAIRMDDLLTGDEVCRILNIKPRTLQTYRDNGLLKFSQIERKIFYYASDLKEVIHHTKSSANRNSQYVNKLNEDLPLEDILEKIPHIIRELLDKNPPMFDGERYLTDKELMALLHISDRTLQNYRTNNLLPYYQLAGKILYKESDIKKLLEDNLVK